MGAKPQEKRPSADAGLEDLFRTLLGEIGEDASREGLLATPRRAAEAWRHFTTGYHVDVDKLVAEGVFEDAHEGLVLVRDIDFYSVCEHHLVPFFGKCHVAYLPDRRLIGLSKVARIVEAFSRRLQVQERMTAQIAQTIEKHLGPQGVAVLVEAQHLCMMMRGVEKHDSSATTSAMLGRFRADNTLLTQFYHQVGYPRRG
ncbi:MAG: GTP cyclohydrolase I FolE [Candidatus Krumholzibacteria bacterium]|nr:GTP cyclohydrolase I FolE [Candidatus Krumholzibacteria bacterium]